MPRAWTKQANPDATGQGSTVLRELSSHAAVSFLLRGSKSQISSDSGLRARVYDETRGSLTLLSTPPFFFVPFAGLWEPEDRGANPTFRVLELELLSARAQLRESRELDLSTQSHHPGRTRPFIALQKLACRRSSGWPGGSCNSADRFAPRFGGTWICATRQS